MSDVLLYFNTLTVWMYSNNKSAEVYIGNKNRKLANLDDKCFRGPALSCHYWWTPTDAELGSIISISEQPLVITACSHISTDSNCLTFPVAVAAYLEHLPWHITSASYCQSSEFVWRYKFFRWCFFTVPFQGLFQFGQLVVHWLIHFLKCGSNKGR